MDLSGMPLSTVWSAEDFSREADAAGVLHADLSARAVRLEGEHARLARIVLERGVTTENAVVVKALESSVHVVRSEAEAWGQCYSVACEAAIAIRAREEAEMAARAEAAAEARALAAARAAAGRAVKEAMTAREGRAAAESIAAEAETISARIALVSADKEANSSARAAKRESALAAQLAAATARAEALAAEAESLRERLASSEGTSAAPRSAPEPQLLPSAGAGAADEAAEAERARLVYAKEAAERLWLASGVCRPLD